MLMVTTDSIVGKEIVEVKGLVKGSTVRSKHIGKDIGASLKTIVGGELNGYNEMFRPDDTITRGEMAVILDRMMYYTEKQQNTFTDLDQAFYTDPILKAAKAGILLQSNALIQPKQTMTKQEAIVMFAKALGISPIEGNTDFEDDAQIAD